MNKLSARYQLCLITYVFSFGDLCYCASEPWNVKAHSLSAVHKKGNICAGHAGDLLYNELEKNLKTMETVVALARLQARHREILLLLRKLSFFHGYMDITCTFMPEHDLDCLFRMDTIELMLKLFTHLELYEPRDWTCQNVFYCLVRIIENLAVINTDRVACMLASAYAIKARLLDSYAQTSLALVHQVMSKKSDADIRCIVLSKPVFPVLALAHKIHDETLERWHNFYIYEKGASGKKDEMLDYIHARSLAGDALALCYKVAMILNKRDHELLPECHMRLRVLAQKEQDRQLLDVLLEQTDMQTWQWLDAQARGHNKHANACLGVLAYTKKDYACAFKSLRYCADLDLAPYWYFCLAELFRRGRGHAQSPALAVKLYERAMLARPDLDLQEEIDISCTDIAQKDYMPAASQLLLLRMSDPGCDVLVRRMIDVLLATKSDKQQECVMYLRHPKRMTRINAMAVEGISSAQYALNFLRPAI